MSAGAVAVDGRLADDFRRIRRVQLHRRFVGMRVVGLGLCPGVSSAALMKPTSCILSRTIVASYQCALRVGDRIAAGRELRDRGQHGAFGQGQLVQRLAVVELGGGGDAVAAVPEENPLVEIELEDLVLAQFALHLERQEHLGEFAGV